MPELQIKRNQILVMRTFQLKYAAVILIAMLITAVSVGADFYISLHGFIREYLKDLPDRSLEQLMVSMNQLLYAKIVVLILIAVAISLYVSHKFAGPVIHIEKSIEKVSKGDLTHKIYLRAGDELKDLANYFNYMTGRFKEIVKTDRSTINEALKQIEVIKNKIADISSKDELDKVRKHLAGVTSFWNIGQ